MGLNPLIIPLALVAIITASLSMWMWRTSRLQSRPGLCILLLAVTFWMLAEMAWVGLSGSDSKMLALKLEYVAVSAVPVAWLAFSLQYVGLSKWLSPRNLFHLCLVPFATVVLVWTNELHGLMWASHDIREVGWATVWEREYGLWFWVNLAYSYLLLTAGGLLILKSVRLSFHLYRRQSILLLSALAVPLAWNIIYTLQVPVFKTLDLTAFVFAISAVALSFGMRKYELFEVAPVNRDSATDQVEIGLVVLDSRSRIVDINSAAQLLLHVSERQCLGKTLEEAVPMLAAIVDKLSTHGFEPSTIASLDQDASHEYRISLSPMSGHDGKNSGSVVTINDITELRRAEKRLEDSYRRELELRRRLEAETTERIEFTRALVHELRTPITSVMAVSEIMGLEVKEEPVISMAKSIHRGVSHLNARIGELLELARGELGRLEIEKEPEDLAKVLKDIVEEMIGLATSQDKTLEVDVPTSLPPVEFDAQRIRQVVFNLLDNALKHTHSGGKIRATTWAEENRVVVQVRDDGVGMSEEDLKKLFKPYVKLSGNGGGMRGLGLGLALSRLLIRKHGGDIRAESVKGQGSTFTFWLPLHSMASATKLSGDANES